MKWMKWVMLMGGMVVLLTLTVWGQAVRCSRCKRTIRGGETYYVTELKESLCSDCKKYLTPTSCKVCATPMPNGGAEFRGNYGYCTNCATLMNEAMAERCIACKGPLHQRIVADGTLVCSPGCASKYRMDKVGAHALSALKCANCGRELAQNDGRGIRCYAGQVACSDECVSAMFPRCGVCKRKTPSQRIVAGKIVCSDNCARTLMAPCVVCHRPCDAETSAPVCADCRRTAVRSQTEGEALLSNAQGEISWLFGVALGCNPKLVLTNHEAIQAVMNGDEGSSDEGTGTTKGLYVSQRMRDRETGEVFVSGCTIYALGDLPKEHLRDVLAHEATHHWLAHHACGKLANREEGFCEYMATIVSLFHKNTAVANAKLDNLLTEYNKEGLMWWIRNVGQPPRAPSKGMAYRWLETDLTLH